MKNFNADDIVKTLWHTFGAFVLLAALTLVLAFLTSTKKVDGYYLSSGEQSSGALTCVYAHWTWHPDERAFCTDDYQKALDFAVKANAQVK